MATKQEKAIQRAVTRENKKGIAREERHVLWFLIALILLLLYLLFAQHAGWWPYSRPKLGSAFFTNVSSQTTAPQSTAPGNDSGSGGGGSGGTGGGGNTGGGTGGGSTTTPSDSIADFAATINVGNTKTQVSGQASGLGQGCAVLASADATAAGHQEVCTYTQGDKIVTVTYLNDRVISASKSGF